MKDIFFGEFLFIPLVNASTASEAAKRIFNEDESKSWENIFLVFLRNMIRILNL